MAIVAIFCHMEEGHLLPSLGLANTLREDGHEVLYLIIKDRESLVRDAGFSSEIIFPDIYPAGITNQVRQRGKDEPLKSHLIPLLEGALDHIFAKIKPDLLLIDYAFSFEALIIHYRHSIKQVLFCTYLREESHTPKAFCLAYFRRLERSVSIAVLDFIHERTQKINFNNLNEIVSPIGQVPELILCPKEFDFPGNEFHNQPVHFIEPCVGFITKRFEPGQTRNSKKNILLSFGSQTFLYREEFAIIINHLLAIMQNDPFTDFHLIVALGHFIDQEKFIDVPSNVTMVRWVDQNEVLQECNLVLTHGGLGTVKQCIYFGVPMIVFPMTRDQPQNALRIEQHNLGKKLDFKSLDMKILAEAMVNILTNPAIKSSVDKMQGIFRDKEKQKLGCRIINEYLKK